MNVLKHMMKLLDILLLVVLVKNYAWLDSVNGNLMAKWLECNVIAITTVEMVSLVNMILNGNYTFVLLISAKMMTSARKWVMNMTNACSDNAGDQI